jgi:predicted ester cyclase
VHSLLDKVHFEPIQTHTACGFQQARQTLARNKMAQLDKTARRQAQATFLAPLASTFVRIPTPRSSP